MANRLPLIPAAPADPNREMPSVSGHWTHNDQRPPSG